MREEKTHIITEFLKNVCQKDDQKSFEELFKLFYEKLINFCMHYIKHKESAEEIVLDIFLKLWTIRKDSTHIQNLETYLFIAVKNRSLNYLKQFSSYRIDYLEDTGTHQLVNTHSPEKELEKRELIFKMNQAIDSLPNQCKIIFNLVKEGGLKYKEVAEILNISPRTVETQLVRAIKKLDIILSPYVSPYKVQPKSKVKIPSLIKPIFFNNFFLSL